MRLQFIILITKNIFLFAHALAHYLDTCKLDKTKRVSTNVSVTSL